MTSSARRGKIILQHSELKPTTLSTLSAVSRTSRCPCGSGKRYKDCHGSLQAGRDLPARADSLLREAQVAFAAGRHRDAAASLRRLLEFAPDNVAAWILLGECLKPTDDAAANEAWWRALDRDPENAEASFHLGNRLREQGEHVAAIIHYERALRSAPNHPAVLNNLGLALDEIGERERAEGCYRQVLAVDPQHTGALANLANLLSAREAIGEANAVYDRLFAIRRDWPASVWIRRAMAQNRVQDLSGAIESYREAARLAPDDMQVRLHLGTLYVQQGRHADGEAALQRALELARSSDHAPIAGVLGEDRPIAAGGVCLQPASRRRKSVSAPGQGGLRALPRRQSGVRGRHRPAHSRGSHRDPRRSQRLHAQRQRRYLRAPTGAAPDQLHRLSGHARRRMVRLHLHRSLQRARASATLLHRATAVHAAHGLPERHHASAAGAAAHARRLWAARIRVCVLLLQQLVQDTARGLRHLDAAPRRGAGQRAVAPRHQRRGAEQSAWRSKGRGNRSGASYLRAGGAGGHSCRPQCGGGSVS